MEWLVGKRICLTDCIGFEPLDDDPKTSLVGTVKHVSSIGVEIELESPKKPLMTYFWVDLEGMKFQVIADKE